MENYHQDDVDSIKASDSIVAPMEAPKPSDLNTTIIVKSENQDEKVGYSDYLPFASIVIALVALYVSFRVFVVNRRHNKLSLKPLLIFRADTSHSKGKARFYILNKGLGPCIIEEFIFSYNEKKDPRVWVAFDQVKKEFNYKMRDFNSKYNLKVYPLKGYSVTPDEDKTLLKYQLNKSKEENKDFYKSVSQIKIEYRYRDYYDQIVTDEFIYFRDLHNSFE